MRPVTNDGCLLPVAAPQLRRISFRLDGLPVPACPCQSARPALGQSCAIQEPYSLRPRQKGHRGTNYAIHATQATRHDLPPPLPSTLPPARMPRSSCAARCPIPVRSLRSIESPSRSISSTIPRCRCRCRCRPLVPGMQPYPQLASPLGIWVLAAARRHRRPRRCRQRPVQKEIQGIKRDTPSSLSARRRNGPPAASVSLVTFPSLWQLRSKGILSSVLHKRALPSRRQRHHEQLLSSDFHWEISDVDLAHCRSDSLPGWSSVACLGFLPPTARAFCSVM